MSIFKQLNDMHDNDKAAFDLRMSSIANNIDSEDNENFNHVDYETRKFEENGLKIIYGERSVQARLGAGGIRTYIEAAIYYVIGSNGVMVKDEELLKNAYSAMEKRLDAKYGKGFVKV